MEGREARRPSLTLAEVRLAADQHANENQSKNHDNDDDGQLRVLRCGGDTRAGARGETRGIGTGTRTHARARTLASPQKHIHAYTHIQTYMSHAMHTANTSGPSSTSVA